MSEELKLPAIRIKQPIGDFFIASISSKDLCEVTKIDIRRLAGERGFETYLGIQRPRSEERVRKISKYVSTSDACFPTSVILAVSGKCASYNTQSKELTLKPYINTADDEKTILYNEMANVLDGQHRIEGLKQASLNCDFDINVSIFIDIDIAEQAYIFSTINLAQTKVNKSLVYDLFSLEKKKSPQKSCHQIAVALDQDKRSPFYQRIKRLGVATEGRFNETITQATFVESLLNYISDDPVKDRDVYLKGGKLKLKTADELNKLIFANMFIEDKELQITDVIWNYFDAIKKRWPTAWDYSGNGLMLNKTNGFKALMRFLRPAYLYLTKPGGVPKVDEFYSVFKKIDLDDESFTVEEYKPGSSGEGKLFGSLREKSKL